MRRYTTHLSAKKTGLFVVLPALCILLTAKAETDGKSFPDHPWFSVQQVARHVLRISDHNIDTYTLFWEAIARFHETDTTYVPAMIAFRDGHVLTRGGRRNCKQVSLPSANG